MAGGRSLYVAVAKEETMRPDEVAFCIRRALEERGKAEACHDPAVARSHRGMANEYERRAKGIQPVTMALVDESSEKASLSR